MTLYRHRPWNQHWDLTAAAITDRMGLGGRLDTVLLAGILLRLPTGYRRITRRQAIRSGLYRPWDADDAQDLTDRSEWRADDIVGEYRYRPAGLYA